MLRPAYCTVVWRRLDDLLAAWPEMTVGHFNLAPSHVFHQLDPVRNNWFAYGHGAVPDVDRVACDFESGQQILADLDELLDDELFACVECSRQLPRDGYLGYQAPNIARYVYCVDCCGREDDWS